MAATVISINNPEMHNLVMSTTVILKDKYVPYAIVSFQRVPARESTIYRKLLKYPDGMGGRVEEGRRIDDTLVERSRGGGQ